MTLRGVFSPQFSVCLFPHSCDIIVCFTWFHALGLQIQQLRLLVGAPEPLLHGHRRLGQVACGREQVRLGNTPSVASSPASENRDENDRKTKKKKTTLVRGTVKLTVSMCVAMRRMPTAISTFFTSTEALGRNPAPICSELPLIHVR